MLQKALGSYSELIATWLRRKRKNCLSLMESEYEQVDHSCVFEAEK